ncbi:30S ribosomal protein S19 [Candidatus Pacearchaeota archaeon CG10_big_fil_rev_8_21_14_0_10_32_14]|nr:MAG: 30S ribosomal protein S19 [Candidatus Pacearchaeota archaeon CG10_big_fil_rev_8_21_14_0_10_32_14]
MAQREFTYRGISLEELKKLDVREFAKYLKARSRRTVLRQFRDIENFIARSRKKLDKKKLVKTHDREMVIVPAMVGWRVMVHNGRGYEQVDIVEEMLGHRFGEFSQTRSKIKHGSAGVGATKGSKAKSKK